MKSDNIARVVMASNILSYHNDHEIKIVFESRCKSVLLLVSTKVERVDAFKTY